MALSPLGNTPRAVEVTRIIRPSRTYAVDFDTGEIGGFIDGEDAVRQFIRKAIATARFRFPIYNAQYGCELDTAVGQDTLQADVPRIIREALIYDDRVKDVRSFLFTREGDKLYVEFAVVTTDGVIQEEVTL